jgi:hypothetical protein
VTRKPIHIEVAMPSGPAHYWREMRARPNGFTVCDIALSSEGVAYATVKRYVWFLQKAGFVVKIGEQKSGYATRSLYAIKKDSRAAPIERADPLVRPPTGREALWTAMRALAQFSVAELAVSASTEERPVSGRSASLFVLRLVQAGAIEVIEAPRRASGRPLGSRAGLYRLKRAANTGPLPPKICVANFVFDPNKNRVLGDAIVSEAKP